MRVATAVSVARAASSKTEVEQDSTEVIANPMGLQSGLMAWRTSFSRLTFVEMLEEEEEPRGILWDDDCGSGTGALKFKDMNFNWYSIANHLCIVTFRGIVLFRMLDYQVFRIIN